MSSKNFYMTPVHNRGAGTTNFLMLKKTASFILAVFLLTGSFVNPAFAQSNGGGNGNGQENSESSNTETTESSQSSETSSLEESSLDFGASSMSMSSFSSEGGAVFITDTGILNGAPDVDAQTGAYKYDYQITIPEGRDGMRPQISLKYNSNNREVGNIYGYGWSVPMMKIERLNKNGVEKMYGDFNFKSDLDGELVSSDDINFVAEFEKGSYRNYEFDGSRWIVYDKTGTRYSFGSTSASQFVDLASSTRVYQWYLDEIRDTNDNYIKFEYQKDNGKVYPQTITYTGSGSTDGIYTINFTLETRPDTYVSYATGFPATTTKRVSEILVNVNSSWVRKYELDYSSGENGNRSLLSSVAESGQGDAGTVTLPAVTFEYSSIATSSQGWSDDNSFSVPERIITEHESYDNGVRLFDVNGDGYADITIYKTGNLGVVDPEQTIYLNRGSEWATTSEWTFPQPYSDDFAFVANIEPNGDVIETGARFVDVNGDGYTDILWSVDDCINSYGCVDFRKTYLNNKVDGWDESTTTWQLPSDVYFYGGSHYYDYGNRLVDVNGDGLVDIVKSTRRTLNGGGSWTYTKKTYMNTGSGWEEAGDEWDLPVIVDENNNGDEGTRLVDLNGDGLIDVVRHVNSDYDQSTLEVDAAYINTGKGWVQNDNWKSPIPILDRRLNYGKIYRSTRLMDVNGDGLVDIFANETGTYNDEQEIYINTGEGWSQQTSNWDFDSSNLLNYGYGSYFVADAGVRVVDFDGDNMIDFIKHGPINTYPNNATHVQEVLIHKGGVPDLLTTVTTAKGGVISAEYNQSARYKVNGNQANSTIAMNLDTLSKLTEVSGLGDIKEIRYSYEDGHYFHASSTNRQFAGFGKVSVATDLGTTTTYYHQGNSNNASSSESSDGEGKIGLSYRTEVYDTSDNLHMFNRTNWATSSAGERVFVYTESELQMDYDGDSDHKDRATAFAYDNSDGSVLTVTEYGEVSGNVNGTYSDTGSDKRTTEYDYATNTDGVVVVDTETLKNNSGTKVKESKYYYDSQSHGSVTAGNLTKREDWVTGSTYVDTEWTYNSYGQPTSETDPNGNTTYFGYDTNNLFPASTTNALGHTVWKDFDYSSGQVGTTTDQNGEVYVTTYDGLDRPLTEQIPDPQTGSLVTKSAYTYTDTAGAVKVQKTDYLNNATSTNSYTYLDGFGRPFQERVEAEDSNTYIVRDYIYGNNGLLAKESLPYFDTGSASSTPTTDDELYSVYEYDALERTTAVGTVVGTTTTSYDQWQETVTDALSNDKHFTYDAFGRLSQVTEHNSTSTYDTDYEYDVNDNLTKITDALNNERNIEYDGLSRRTLLEDLHDPNDTSFGEWEFSYDAASNLGTTTDPKNQTIVYNYDALNRMLTENYTGQSGTEVTYTYDSCTEGVGYLCSVGNSVATTSYTYAKTGAVASEAKQINGTTYTTEYDYDRQGNQTLVTYPDDSEVAYTYNKGGQIERIQQREDGGSFMSVMDDFDYGPHSLVTYQLHGNGSETTKTYDADELYRLRSITTTATSSYGTGNGGEELMLLESELDLLASSSETVFEEVDVPEVEGPVSTTTTEVAAEQIEEPVTTTTEEVLDTATSTEEVIATSTPETATTTSSSTETTATTTSSSTEASTTTITFDFASSTELIEESFSSTSTAVTTEAVIIPEPELPDVVPHKHEHTDKLITDTHEARIWQKYHRERVAELRKQEDLDPQILQNAIAAQDRFEDFLKKEGYTKNKGQDVSTSVRDVIFGIFGSMVENVTAWLLPEKLYAYLFAVEDFEDCSSLPCSLDTDSSWGSVTPSLDSTSQVEGTDSLKEVVTGEGNGSIQTINYDEDEIYVQFKIYVPDPVTWGASSYFSILRFEDSSDGTVFWISVEDWGAPRLIINGDVLSYTNTSLNLTEGAVNTIEVRFKKGTSDGEVDIWLNNDTEGSPDYSSGTTNTGADNVDDILFGVTYAPESGVSTTYFDDLVIDSTFIGDISETSGPTPGVPFVGNVQDLTYTYDAVGNITQIIDNSGTDSAATTTYGYDDLYRLTSASTTAASTTPYNRTYSYNAIGNILSKSDQGSYSYDGNQTSGSSYTLYDDTVASGWADQSWASSVDPDDTSPVNNGTKSIEVVYASAWQGLKYKNNDFDTTDYDDLEIAVNVGTDTSVNLYLYFRDSNDTLLDVVNLDSYNGGSWSANTWEELTIPLTALDMDNRTGTTSMHIEADGASTINYDDIKFTSVSGSASYANPHAATEIETTSGPNLTFTYDSNGNMTSGGAWTYGWDYKNRLISAGNGLSSTTYAYDFENRRVRKTVDGVDTIYPSNLFEVSDTGTSTKHIYVGEMLVASIEDDTPAPKIYYNHLDHLNSTRVTTDQTGYTQSVADYFPFGETRIDEQYGEFSQNRKYLGEVRDDETSLNYLGSRYQSGQTAKFTSQDQASLDLGSSAWEQVYNRPLEVFLRDPQQLNTYSYARNNPIVISDPEGDIIPLAIAAVMAGLTAYDAYTTGVTLSDPNASLGEKGVAVALFASPVGEFKAGIKGISKADNIIRNAIAGRAREAAFAKTLSKQFPGSSVQREVYLRNADGTIARDAFGSARRLDFAVIKDGQVQDLYEVTSKTANKAAQIRKEEAIRQAGGTYIKDRSTGDLIDVSKKQTKERRLD